MRRVRAATDARYTHGITDQAGDRRQRHVSADRGTHHPHVADESQQRIGQESANDAEQDDVDDRVEAAECGEDQECDRHRPASKRPPRDDEQHQPRSRPAHRGKEHVNVGDRGERAQVIQQPVTRWDAEVVGLDGDERHPKHQRSPEQSCGAGDGQIAAGRSFECHSQQSKY